MKEYDEYQAAELMSAAVTGKCSPDDALEIIDIIFDWYEQNGELDIDFDDADDTDNCADIAAYVRKTLRNSPLSAILSDDDIAAMVAAETDYENSLL